VVTQSLNAWMNGELVGTWLVDRNSHAFRYEASWLESPRRRSISLSLPISGSLELKGPEVRNYFDNLLPDNERIRSRLRRRFSRERSSTCWRPSVGTASVPCNSCPRALLPTVGIGSTATR
jgi:serine/threonine-protein kinase HipA